MDEGQADIGVSLLLWPKAGKVNIFIFDVSHTFSDALWLV